MLCNGYMGDYGSFEGMTNSLPNTFTGSPECSDTGYPKATWIACKENMSLAAITLFHLLHCVLHYYTIYYFSSFSPFHQMFCVLLVRDTAHR